ncbi:hypothetical protein DENSPDRAFT_886373 [Dentipellis sp. KUC8613]|nr:hypothetical protein DENSPDRAFT_886373 [Dentipellis sp. KUC8613]
MEKCPEHVRKAVLDHKADLERLPDSILDLGSSSTASTSAAGASAVPDNGTLETATESAAQNISATSKIASIPTMIDLCERLLLKHETTISSLYNNMIKMLRGIQGTSGFCGFIVLGGPRPSKGGQIETMVIHCGPGGAINFGQSYDGFGDNVMKPFEDFLSNVFPPKHRHRHALPAAIPLACHQMPPSTSAPPPSTSAPPPVTFGLVPASSNPRPGPSTSAVPPSTSASPSSTSTLPSLTSTPPSLTSVPPPMTFGVVPASSSSRPRSSTSAALPSTSAALPSTSAAQPSTSAAPPSASVPPPLPSSSGPTVSTSTPTLRSESAHGFRTLVNSPATPGLISFFDDGSVSSPLVSRNLQAVVHVNPRPTLLSVRKRAVEIESESPTTGGSLRERMKPCPHPVKKSKPNVESEPTTTQQDGPVSSRTSRDTPTPSTSQLASLDDPASPIASIVLPALPIFTDMSPVPATSSPVAMPDVALSDLMDVDASISPAGPAADDTSTMEDTMHVDATPAGEAMHVDVATPKDAQLNPSVIDDGLTVDMVLELLMNVQGLDCERGLIYDAVSTLRNVSDDADWQRLLTLWVQFEHGLQYPASSKRSIYFSLFSLIFLLRL